MIGLVLASEVSPFGRWVRRRREELGLSLRDLAARTNGACTYSLIGQLETGRGGKRGAYRPRTEIVDALAKALGADRNEARAIASGYNLDDSAGFLFRIGGELQHWDDLTESQKQAVMEVAQAAIKAILDISEESKGVLGGTLKLPRANEKRKTG